MLDEDLLPEPKPRKDTIRQVTRIIRAVCLATGLVFLGLLVSENEQGFERTGIVVITVLYAATIGVDYLIGYWRGDQES
jgi:hypothetical protein